jgi:flagellar hook-associated protein 2
MASIQSPGIASGLDVNSLVSQLVAAERAPTELRLNRSDEKIKTQVSALGLLKGAMSSLLASLAALKSESAFQVRKTASSAEDSFTATATAAAAPGDYSVEVLSTATAHKLKSGLIAGGSSAVIGTGTLTLAVGAQSFEVVIDGTKNTLAGIRDAINAAPDNKGVRASIVNSSGGAVITLTANDTGAAKTLRVTQSGGDGGLAALVYDPPTLANLTEVVAAADASINVEGFNSTSAGNTFSNVIDGVTITVKAADVGNIHTLNVANDAEATVEKVKKVVTDYNAAMVTMGQLRRYNPTTKDAGPLLGDAMLRGIETTLRNAVSDSVSTATAAFNTMASIGITTQQDGTLKLDESKLNSALSSSFDAVGKLFGSTAGVAARMHAFIDTQLKTDAPINSRTDALNSNKRINDRDRERLEARMTAVELRYRRQFSALDTVLAGLQQTSAFLAQRLGASSQG